MRVFVSWLVAALLATTVVRADEVGSFSNDWTGNRIIVDAIPDPKIQGITCHVTHFDRSIYDRLTKGKWFEDPSNTSIACRQTGNIVIGSIDLSRSGEDVFSERMSLVFKHIAVRRIYDRANDTLIYVAYSREVKDASAKMNVSTVTLHNANPEWRSAKPN
jgi:CreA protein